MERLSDTPPDGDFARYIEQLSAQAAAAAVVKQAATRPGPGQGPAPAATSAARPAAAKDPSPSQPAGLSLWTIGKWVLIPWVVIQLVAGLGWQVGLFLVPVLLLVAAWLVYRFKKSSGLLLPGRLRELAEQVSREFKQGK